MRTTAAVIGLIVLAVAVLYGVAAADLGLWAPWAANKRTEIVRNTNQYVETQRRQILGDLEEYDRLETFSQTPEIDRAQHHIVLSMCEAADQIDRQYVPEQALSLMTAEGCYR